MHAAPAIDRRRLAEVALGCGVPERTLLEELVTMNAADLLSFRAALEGEDRTRVAEVAHRVGGASRMIGATALANACDELAAACAGGLAEDVRDAAARVEAQVARLQSSIG